MDKKCKKCQQIKKLSEFYAHKKMADGHLSFCKQCVRQRVDEHRQLNIERIREYDRQRERRKNSKPINKTQRQAHIKIGNAIRAGVMQRKPCIICGKQKSEAHHQDYSKPYDVIWLCPVHHRMLHHKRLSLIPAKK